MILGNGLFKSSKALKMRYTNSWSFYLPAVMDHDIPAILHKKLLHAIILVLTKGILRSAGL